MLVPIDDPLWNLMLSTHGCTPSCGCGADFNIDPQVIGYWIDDFGEEFARVALRQLDDLIAGGGSTPQTVTGQREGVYLPPERVAAWLLRWRPAIEQALHDFLTEVVPSVAQAEASRAAALNAMDVARHEWSGRERHAMNAASKDPSWLALVEEQWAALRKLKKSPDSATEAKLKAVLDSTQAARVRIEDGYRGRDPAHALAKSGLQKAEAALAEAERLFRRATARAAGRVA